MTIESAVFLRRIARTACLVLIVGLIVCGAGIAQAPIQAPVPVISGSIIPFPHGTTGSWSQVSRMARSSNGTVLFIDYAISKLYQWTPGTAAPVVVIESPSGGGNSTGGSLDAAWNNSGMAIDKWDNLYVSDRFGGNNVRFLRAPYDAASGTWIFTSGVFPAGSNWFTDFAVPGNSGSGTQDIAIAPDPCNAGAETMYVSDSAAGNIVKFPINQDGTHGTVVSLATKLMTDVSMLAVDHAGNIYFIENAYSAPSTRVNGVRIIPACHATYVGDTTGSVDKTLATVDDLSEGQSWKGISVDAAGNLYLSSSDDLDQGNTYGGISDMVLMVPNEGTPTTPNLVWADRVIVSPVGAGFSALPDSRGFLWIPVNSSVNWAPEGYLAPQTCGCFSSTGKACTSTITGNYNSCVQKSVVLWSPGTLNAGSSPVATAGSPQTVFFSFNQPVTPGGFAFAGSGGANFVTQDVPSLWTVDPNARVSGLPPCVAGANYGPAASPTDASTAGGQKNSWCMLNLELSAARAGAVSGELQVLDAKNSVIAGSNTIVTGIGQGANVSLMANAVVQSVATGLQAPQQVAADALGNSYVADSTLKFVKEFSAGSTSASGVGIGIGLGGPTGVAVDGVGNVYIGDKGTVYEIPFVNGALAPSQQVALATGLGSQLNLAVDGGGHVFVADQANKQVVLIANPSADLMLQTEYNSPTSAAIAPIYVNTASGANVAFTGPTAIATDNSGNAYVADGGSIWQLTPMFGASQIIANLSGTVTGLAVDPSGSLWLAEPSGLIWVPYNSSTGVYNVNGEVQVASGLTTPPYSVALDGMENAYATYGTGASAGLTRVTIGGTLDLGIVTPFLESYVGAELFNVGNEPLTLNALSGDVFSGTNASDYSLLDQYDTPACDPSAPTAAGQFCYLDVDLTATTTGPSSSMLTVTSNAVNASGGVTITSAGDAEVDPRPATTTTVTVNETASVYPGGATVTVAVAAGSGTPDGTVTLSITNLPRQTLTLSGGTASYTTPALNGGKYRVVAAYPGSGTSFAASGQSTTFTVATFAPAVTVGTPVGSSKTESDWQGNHFVGVGTSNTITVTVAATGVGSPTGTVRFLQNGQPLDSSQDPVRLNGNGQAVFNTDNLTIGTYNLTALYSGDTNFSSVTPATPLTFYVITSSIQITSTPATVSLTAGTPGQATLTLKPLVGFTSITTAVKCVASTMPQYSECTFTTPKDIYIGRNAGDATAPTSIVVTISTNVPVNVTNTSALAKPMRWSLAGVFGLGMLGLLAGRRRCNRYVATVCLTLMLAGGALSITACTNAGYSTPPVAPKVKTPAGTYNVQIVTLDEQTNEQTSLTSPVFTLPVTVQ